jgi:hypothetical protein
MQVDERRPPTPQGVARRHADHGALVQTEHELEVIWEVGEERDLGRARIAEDRRQAMPAHDVERGVANRRHRGSSLSSPTWTATQSLAAERGRNSAFSGPVSALRVDCQAAVG